MVTCDGHDGLAELEAEREGLFLRVKMFDLRWSNWNAGRYPRYGYTRDSKRRGKLIVNPTEQGIIRVIMKLRADGMATTAITKHLNKAGYPHRSENFPNSLTQNVIIRVVAGQYDLESPAEN